MYTLEQLQQKTFKQLKEIGWQLNVFPAADRRCRQNWIDAIVGVNPPLLQLLEVSPAASAVEQVQEPIIETLETPSAVEVEPVQTLPIESKFGRIVYPRLAQKPIVQSVENFPGVDPGVEVDPVEEPIVPAKNSPPVEVDPVEEPIVPAKNSPAVEVDPVEEPIVPAKNSPAVEVDPVEEPIVPAKNSPAVEVDRVEEPIVPAKNFPAVEVDRVEEPIVPAKNSPGSRSKASTAHQLLELFQSRAHIIEDSPGVKTEATASESAIVPAAKNRILTEITFSDRFLARYSPPQPEIIHFQSDAGGQLSLLNFEIESVDEPPDPDDFESLEAFREALARWDSEHPEELAASLDSMREWAPCPADWYEFDTLARIVPSVAIVSPARKISITSDFFIPTFDCLSDRPHRSDEPPDTGIYARLPKPKPPSFPPATVGQGQPKPQPTATQLQAKRIPNAYQTHTCCIAVGSSTQPARSPPGGDAGF